MALAARTYDTLLQMEDGAALIAATEVTSGGIFDTGGAVSGAAARWVADMVFNVTALEIASNDELYRFVIQGSNSATFASGIENLAFLELGALETLLPDADVDSIVGKYVVPFANETPTGTYRYLRLKVVVSGTIATGILLTAFMAKRSD